MWVVTENRILFNEVYRPFSRKSISVRNQCTIDQWRSLPIILLWWFGEDHLVFMKNFSFFAKSTSVITCYLPSGEGIKGVILGLFPDFCFLSFMPPPSHLQWSWLDIGYWLICWKNYVNTNFAEVRVNLFKNKQKNQTRGLSVLCFSCPSPGNTNLA